MSIIKELGKRISTSGQGAMKAVTGLVEVSKLNDSIAENEERLKALYADLGHQLYEQMKERMNDGAYAALGEQIAQCRAELERLKKEVQLVQNEKTCPKCGGRCSFDSVFCPSCGTNFEVIPEKPAFCTGCGAKREEDKLFCSACGQKFE